MFILRTFVRAIFRIHHLEKFTEKDKYNPMKDL